MQRAGVWSTADWTGKGVACQSISRTYRRQSQTDFPLKVSKSVHLSSYVLVCPRLLAVSCGGHGQVRLQVGAASSASLTKLLTLSHAWRRRGGHGLILHLAAHGDEDWVADVPNVMFTVSMTS